MKEGLRNLAETLVRDHLREPYDVVDPIDAGEFLEEAAFDVDVDMDDFYVAIKDQLGWLVDRLDQRAADDGMHP